MFCTKCATSDFLAKPLICLKRCRHDGNCPHVFPLKVSKGREGGAGDRKTHAPSAVTPVPGGDAVRQTVTPVCCRKRHLYSGAACCSPCRRRPRAAAPRALRVRWGGRGRACAAAGADASSPLPGLQAPRSGLDGDGLAMPWALVRCRVMVQVSGRGNLVWVGCHQAPCAASCFTLLCMAPVPAQSVQPEREQFPPRTDEWVPWCCRGSGAQQAPAAARHAGGWLPPAGRGARGAPREHLSLRQLPGPLPGEAGVPPRPPQVRDCGTRAPCGLAGRPPSECPTDTPQSPAPEQRSSLGKVTAAALPPCASPSRTRQARPSPAAANLAPQCKRSRRRRRAGPGTRRSFGKNASR